MKYKFIMEHRKEFRLGKMCEILEVSKSGYHNYVKEKVAQRRRENALLLEQIRKVHIESRGIFGSPRVHKELLKQGFKCNRKRVVRLMRANGIRSKIKRRYKVTTDSDHQHPVAENLLNQNFNAAELNKVWVSDLTYIWTSEGWLYLVCILDLCSRRIVGWSMGISPNSRLVTTAIQTALDSSGINPGLIFHSDRGIQYAAEETRNFLSENEMIQSMSRKGNCFDNAVMESFFHTLKTEMVYFERFQTRQEARMKIFEYIEIFYNRKRSHSSIGYCSPAEFENMKLKAVA